MQVIARACMCGAPRIIGPTFAPGSVTQMSLETGVGLRVKVRAGVAFQPHGCDCTTGAVEYHSS